MSGQHILVVDDTPEVLKLFKSLLTRGGYSTTAVDTGTDALRIVANQQIDLIVLDLSMPQPDGFELLKHLREKYPRLRNLVVSGFMEGTLLRAAELLGATASLNKADAPSMLLKTVKSVLQ